ncbi:hypothetical protein ACWERV_32670 [Streptomyces sp. NPDC004031]
MYTLATRLATAARQTWDRLEQGRRRGDDRGDISITTVIIWGAVIAGALVIASTIAVILTKYNGKLGDL